MKHQPQRNDYIHEYQAKRHAPSKQHRVRDGEGADLRQDYF